MNNKKMNCQVVCAEKSARRIEGTMQMAHTQKSGADARMNALRSFIKTKLAKVYHSPRAGAKIFARRIGGELGGFLKPQHLNASSQTGRSMVEMLGVLAIIGVLTIGGLMGYRYAMNKHKANTILNDVSLAMADLTVLDPDGGAITRRAVALRPDSGLAMESERTADGNNIVYVSGVAKAVCQILIQIQPTDAYEHIYDGDLNALTTCADTQAMAFGSKDSAELPVTPDCNDSKPCTSPKQCENNICVCPTINTPNECQEVQKINGCDVLVNKTNATCGTNGFCSNGACSECTSPKVVNTAKNGCVCPTIEHCGMYDDACKCASCDEGYVVDGTGACIPEQTCTEIQFCTAYNEDCSCANCDDDHMLQANTCVEVECKVDDDCGTNMTCNNGKCECKDSSYAAVVNYNSDGSKNKFACCEVKADSIKGATRKTDYVIAGAINGTCCGGYKNSGEYAYLEETGKTYLADGETNSYKIQTNGGVAYCAIDSLLQGYTACETLKYVAKNKYCIGNYCSGVDTGNYSYCYCSTSGDPKNGSSCDP